MKSTIIIWHIVILFLLTILFWIWDIDLTISKYCFDQEKGGWYLYKDSFWEYLYHYGMFPGLVLAVISLVVLSASFWFNSVVRFRNATLFFIIAIIVGPGLLVNVVLKDHYGRPRPRDIVEFGGTENYLKVLIPGPKGKSFPSGHASIGFYLMIPFLFFIHTRKSIAYGFLAVGTGFGILLGIARIIAGGHYMSDVLWSAGVTWIAALIIAKWIKLDIPVSITAANNERKLSKLSAGILLPLFTVGLVVATPYFSKNNFIIPKKQMSQYKSLNLTFEDADITISEDKDFKIDYQIKAFGFPNSRMGYEWESHSGSFAIKSIGWFTKKYITANVTLPKDHVVKFSLQSGTLRCSLNTLKKYNFQLGKNVKVIH